MLPRTRTVEPISLKLMTTNFYTTLGGAFLVHLNGDFIIKERRQELELELAWNNDRYNRDKVFWDNLNKKY